MQRRCLLAAALIASAGLAAAQAPLRVIAHDSFELPAPLLAQFEREAGVKLQLIKGGDAGEVLNRLILTRAKPIADVAFGIDNALLPRAEQAGVFDAYDGPSAKRPAAAPLGAGVVPVGTKVGIDATIGEGIPRERFERIAYAYADTAKIADYVKGKADKPQPAGNEKAVAELAEKIFKLIEAQPAYYTEIAEKFSSHDFQTVARALGKLHADERLWQDPRGRMCVRGSVHAAKPPQKAS